MNAIDVAAWLAHYQTDGVKLSLNELVNYQRFAHLLDLSPNKEVAGALSGGERSKVKGRGMEFDEARHYQAGDDIRAIDWRVTARTGKTHTKVFREERDRPVFVHVDLLPSMFFGTQYLFKSVQAAHLAALITWSAVQRGDKIGGLMFNHEQDFELKPKAQAKNALVLLNKLQECHSYAAKLANTRNDTQSDKQRFTDMLERLAYVVKPGALVYLISDFTQLDATAKSALSRIARHCEIKATIVTDPMEQRLPSTQVKQSVTVSKGNRKQQIRLGDSQGANEYQQKQAQHFKHIYDTLAEFRISCRNICAGRPIDQQISRRELGSV